MLGVLEFSCNIFVPVVILLYNMYSNIIKDNVNSPRKISKQSRYQPVPDATVTHGEPHDEERVCMHAYSQMKRS